MIRVMDSGRESMMKKKNAAVVADKCLDSQLWHACAGGMVQMPAINSKVFYFPQGHAEHSGGKLDLCGGNPRIPAMILCTVAGIRYMADSETDDVYAKIRLIPTNHHHHHHHDSAEDNLDEGEGFDGGSPENNKPASFVKTLTQSDANNGGGFSVPRYCAETIFPRLDYTAEPPVQAIIAKDVHGVAWKFRHIYRGTPRRHLLTTGWSNFVNQKRLVAGDSIVFLRAESGDLCVGIRRAKKGLGEYPFVGQYEGGVLPGRTLGSRGESVAEEAARLAAAGREFEVAYYPRGSSGGGGGGGGSTPEFCVRAAAVRAAAAIRWCSGMRFKMPFETEDSSRISWFMGTISSVQVADPLRWPDSPWRLLQVAWDEPDLLQNVKRVNPWLVELVANMPPISVSPFSPPRKKLRLPPTPEFPLMGQIPAQFLAGNFLGGTPFCSVPNTTVPAGIQGARHAQFGQYPSDLRHLSELHPGLPFPFLGFRKLHDPPRSPGVNFMNILEKSNENEGSENFSCWLKMGHQHPAPAESLKTVGGEPNKTQPPPPQLLLFGQVILTEEQLSKSSSGENLSGGSGSTLGRSGSRDNFSDEGSPWYKDRRSGDIGPENGHCTEAQRVGLSTSEMSHSGSFVCLN